MIFDKAYNDCRESRSVGESTALARAQALTADPEVRPTPAAALAFDHLPTELHFVRSHFGVPPIDPASWTLQVDGAVNRSGCYALSELRQRPVRTQDVVLECAGHRRNEFRPNAAGLQWGIGAI